MLNTELNTLEVLTINLPTTATKELLLSFINTDEYKLDIEKLASCFLDINSISKNLNVCIVYIREKYPNNPLIIGEYLFDNPLLLYIYKINKNNFDNLYHISLSESNLFVQNSEKWTSLQILIQNMLNIRIANLNNDILVKLFNLISPHKDYHDKAQEIFNLIEKIENPDNAYNEFQVIKEDDEEKPLEKHESDDKTKGNAEIDSQEIGKYTAPVRESKNLLAMPDENDKKIVKLYKVIGPDGRNVRIGLKRWEELQKIISDPQYKKVFVNDLQFPMVENIPEQQNFAEIKRGLVAEAKNQKPANLPKNQCSNSIIKDEEIFDDN